MTLKTLPTIVSDNMRYTSTFIFEKKISTAEAALARKEQRICHFCNPWIVGFRITYGNKTLVHQTKDKKWIILLRFFVIARSPLGPIISLDLSIVFVGLGSIVTVFCQPLKCKALWELCTALLVRSSRPSSGNCTWIKRQKFVTVLQLKRKSPEL